MHYLSFITSINPWVLGALFVVAACGVYDHFTQH